MPTTSFRNSRSARLQTIEESFAQGMDFTDSPLPDGKLHTLVNFDFNTDGTAVMPRKGVRVTGLMKPGTDSIALYREGQKLYTAKECYTAEGDVQSQVIFGVPDLSTRRSNGVCHGSLMVSASDMDAGEPIPGSAEMKRYTEINDRLLADGVPAYFKAPIGQEVHGMPVSNAAQNTQHIGTFAYNDSYFFFGGKDLHMTKHTPYVLAVSEQAKTMELISVDVKEDMELKDVDGKRYLVVPRQKMDGIADPSNPAVAFTYVSDSSGFSGLVPNSVTCTYSTSTRDYTLQFELSEPNKRTKGTLNVFYPTQYTNANPPHYKTVMHSPNVSVDTFVSASELQIDQLKKEFVYPEFTSKTLDSLAQGDKYFVKPDEYYVVVSIAAGLYIMVQRHKLLVNNATSGTHYASAKITPKALSPFEAATLGFNMLSDDPYSFTSEYSSSKASFVDNGLLPYTLQGKAYMNPQVNEKFQLRLYYECPVKRYKIVFTWREQTASDWTPLNTVMLNSNVPYVAVDFVAPVAKFIIRYEVFQEKDTNDNLDLDGDGYQDIPVAANAQNFDFTKEGSAYRPFTDAPNYDLWTATGMTYWKERLLLWGVDGDNTILFSSEIAQPDYFPYDKYVDFFDEPIVHAMVYLEDLLVFTKSKLYSLTMMPDGTSWTRKLIQSNLSVDSNETHLITQVKNMVFFKSGNYYYMVVPKLNTLTGELTIAPVYRQVQGLLDDFEGSVKGILSSLYGYAGALSLSSVDNFLDYESIHNIYTFDTAYMAVDAQGQDTTQNIKVNFDLKYNTVRRAWTIDVFESVDFISLYDQDYTQPGTFISMANDGGKTAFALYNMSQYNKGDSYLLPDTLSVQEGAQRFRNHQLLDTGYRSFDNDTNKRFREVQLKIRNPHSDSLLCSCEFALDGKRRHSYFANMIEDDDGVETVDSLDDSRVHEWLLTRDMFEGNEDASELWKARIKVSGKGLSPRLVFKSHNESDFELLSFGWVYRLMNSR
jgi:hypothetical protein